MFANAYHHALVVLGLIDEPAPIAAPEAEPMDVDFGYLDLDCPEQAFDALRRVVGAARLAGHTDPAPADLDLAA